MNLFVFLLCGIWSTVLGFYKIPEYDTCALRVLLCDDDIKPLTPIDNSTLEMFRSIEELNAVCDDLEKFRACLNDAELFCVQVDSKLDVGFQLLDNRRLAFDMCVRGSSHQQLYMKEQECINNYSHSAIQFCSDKAVERVGLDFYLGDFENECRYLGEIQYCHLAIIADQCGKEAGDLLKKLVVFRGERDFVCIGYENERLNDTEQFYATMDLYIQQYRNIEYKLERKDRYEKSNTSIKDLKTQESKDKVSSEIQWSISPLSNVDGAFDNIYRDDRGQSFNIEFSDTNLEGESRFSDQKYNFRESENSNYPIDIELHSVSSKPRTLENEFQVEGAYKSLNNEENLRTLLSDEIVGEKKLEPHTLHPSKPLISSRRLYHPLEGEIELDDQATSRKSIRMENAEKEVPSSKLSNKDDIENKHVTQRNTDEICSEVQENISESVDIWYSKAQDIKNVNLVDVTELKNSIKFRRGKGGRLDYYRNEPIKMEEPEIFFQAYSQNQNDENYVVTPSSEIETHGESDQTKQDSGVFDLEEEPQALDLEEDIVKVLCEFDSESSELNKDFITKSKNPESLRAEFLELMSSFQNNPYSFSYKFIDASTNNEVASKEKFSETEKTFSKRSAQKNPIDIERVLFETFEIMAELRINVRRMSNIGKILQKQKSMMKIEL